MALMMDVITVRLRREICYPTDSWTSVWASSQKNIKAAKKKLPSPAVPSHSLIIFRPEREHAFGALRKQLASDTDFSPTVKHLDANRLSGFIPVDRARTPFHRRVSDIRG